MGLLYSKWGCQNGPTQTKDRVGPKVLGPKKTCTARLDKGRHNSDSYIHARLDKIKPEVMLRPSARLKAAILITSIYLSLIL